jgi:hypothetical protein
VKEVPPPNFNDQFVKDLLNDDVKRLSQIKWIFDGGGGRRLARKTLKC